MSRKLKEMMVDEMTDRFAGLREHGCVVVGFRGVSAGDSVRLRTVLKEKGAQMMVVRNRLFAIALQQLGAPQLGNLLEGPAAVVTGEDPVQAAKAVDAASELAPALSVLGGYADGSLLDAAGVEKLAGLPSRETLLAQTLACIQAPAQRFANCLKAGIQQLASVLYQIEQKKRREEESGGQ